MTAKMEEALKRLSDVIMEEHPKCYEAQVVFGSGSAKINIRECDVTHFPAKEG